MPADAPPQLFWRFDNVMSDRGVSTAAGIPTGPFGFNGFVSQTGGGPAEVFGDGVGTVFLTRHLGTHEMFVWFTLTQPMSFAGVTFRHWHNHNPGYPTHPKYAIQLQLDSGSGYVDVGEPLELSNRNSGHTDTIALGFELPAGNYKLRFHPRGLKAPHRDTASEFFAIKQLELCGHVFDKTHVVKAPPAVSKARRAAPAAPEMASAKAGDFVDAEVAGVLVPKLKVMESKYGGKCARTGAAFAAGATIGFKHRDALTDEQKAAIFGTKNPGHLMVLLPDPEPAAPADGAPVCCAPDPSRLAPFEEAISHGPKGDEWQYANISCRARAFSCGHLTRGTVPEHKHDPTELALCKQVARGAAEHLRPLRLNDEGRGAPFVPYYAAAVVGAPVPVGVDEALVRAVFGGAISPQTAIDVTPLQQEGARWVGLHDTPAAPRSGAAQARAWHQFGEWFAAQEGLRGHCFVYIGRSDDDPGATMPRLVVALTPAGSLVGAASYVVYG
jgi:hypothetical protein